MAHILIMPRQGNTVESCIITAWKVSEGDTVTPETTVAEVETDKAAFEVPAGAAGTVLKLLYAEGDDVPVLKPIAVIGERGEEWLKGLGTGDQGLGKKESILESISPSQHAQLANDNPQSPVPSPQSPSSPRARNLAAKEALPLEAVPTGTGPGGRIIERDVAAALQNRPALTAAAKAAGPGAVPSAGSGIGGRVTLSDIHSPPLPTPHSPLPNGTITETPLKGIRKIIADRMIKSLAESAQFTLNASAPAAKLQEFRAGAKVQGGLGEELGFSKITINDLILFAVSRTLPRFPFMNAHKIGDTIKTFERVHLGVAVDTPRGLMVPVIRNANLLSLAQISAEAKRLAASCQSGSVNPDELSGSTFSVTNLGSLGITSFTPVLNTPEVAILGVCSIEMKPVMQEKQEAAAHPLPIPHSLFSVNFEPHIGFSLTINHQAVDGAPAARFLKALGDAIAHIDLLLAAG
ncbi:MAG: 2-oxo acid dehydrogenase subunit E2 [Treponema sp.]|nr:2-oxo acid dehydrogenase subunit E2 [Treponema sp.]